MLLPARPPIPTPSFRQPHAGARTPPNPPAHAADPLRHAAARPWNPLHAHPGAGHLSRYLGAAGSILQPVLLDGTPATAQEKAIHGRLRAKILDRAFPCVASRSVLNRCTYRFGSYGELGSAEAALALCHDLYEFAHEFPVGQASFTSLLAAFPAPGVHGEAGFERLLWRQLQLMHDIDSRFFGWDGSVSRDPDDAQFSFSVGGRAFFVVGLHRHASRHARTCDDPVLVFNPHDQFEALRTSGRFEQLQQAIRRRDIDYQGSINPMLDDFGERSESRQYSGRAVPQHWRCPFQPHAGSLPTHDDEQDNERAA